jgi:transcriptional regulator with XRE-family HTH domain
MAQPSDTFRERMREARTQRGLSQRGLATGLRELGYAFEQPTISWIENGTRNISLDEAVAIARVLRVPLGRMYMDWTDYLVSEAEAGY